MKPIERFKERQKQRQIEEDLANQQYGSSRGCHRFLHINDADQRFPLHIRKGSWVLRYFNIRPNDTSDYICYDEAVLKSLKHFDRIPCIEFNAKNGSLEFVKFGYNTKLEAIPPVVHDMIKEFSKDYQNSRTPAPTPVNYLKMYVAVLDTVPDHMVPTLVAHSVLGAHLWIDPIDISITSDCNTVVEERGLYKRWLKESFRKCVVKVNQKEFDKISQLPLTYLGHENNTLGGIKSCAVAYPVWHLDTPKVLKFSKLWKPTNE